MNVESRLQNKFKNEIIPALKKEFGVTNVMQLPVIKKVIINSGIGPFKDNAETVATFESELASIAGQRPSKRRAKTSEAGFKIRKGEVVGFAVTLRGPKMWAFLDKFVNIVLPRVRDFSGLDTNGFDKNGNFSVGVKEHTIFPEINQNVSRGIRSLQVNVVTNSGDTERSKVLLSKLGFPFKKGK